MFSGGYRKVKPGCNGLKFKTNSKFFCLLSFFGLIEGIFLKDNMKNKNSAENRHYFISSGDLWNIIYINYC